MTGLDDLSDAQLLAAAEDNVAARRRAEVDRLRIALAWCDRNGEDPQAQPGAVPIVYGGDRLIVLGGDGTPQVAELCLGELAVALQAGVIATRHLAADALDLRHRLPLFFAHLQAGHGEVWVARRIATLSRDLDRDAVRVVDEAVAAARDEAPSRILAIAEAKIIEADPETHRARVAADAAKTGVWLSRTRAGEAVDRVDGAPATRRLAARLPHDVALEVDAVLADLADALAVAGADEDETGEKVSRDALRVRALELLARPHDAAALLDGLDGVDAEGETEQPSAPRRQRRRAVLHVHLSACALHGAAVTRVEEVGPVLLDQLTTLLRRRDLTVQPVIDLNAVEAVNAYEVPTRVRHRVELRRAVGDGFPHSSGTAIRGLDIDHVTPYAESVSGTGAGQTGDHNANPLTRNHHRLKTHRGYRVTQLGLGAHRWITPHGLARVVTPRGTVPVDLLTATDGTAIGECYPGRIPIDFEPSG